MPVSGSELGTFPPEIDHRVPASRRHLALPADDYREILLETLQRLSPQYSSVLIQLLDRPDLLRLLEAQLSYGSPQSVAPTNVDTDGFGGL